MMKDNCVAHIVMQGDLFPQTPFAELFSSLPPHNTQHSQYKDVLFTIYTSLILL